MSAPTKEHANHYSSSANEKVSVEKPCRSCTDFKTWMKLKGKSTEGKAIDEKHLSTCPLDKNELGRNTWSFLHTMAGYYPRTPSVQEKLNMTQFMQLFAQFYPCDYCAKDMRNDLKRSPPDVSSQDNFSQWLCRLHNTVNKKLGKSEFDCRQVNERWRDGWKDGSCG
ncbi:FAD-linked sulfhydryl oxidase ALR-like [Gigantopelta aegis]|uniref:FAD-linked sulfhydryl oxidase ALR-like n=1 Tax=Gigantopelta aegis TaxID=1735272 RepID=UPI001B88B8FB|nr:FAD-linked sulfhydryl oxidase ALR-like [Gigantopelta aegis]